MPGLPGPSVQQRKTFRRRIARKQPIPAWGQHEYDLPPARWPFVYVRNLNNAAECKLVDGRSTPDCARSRSRELDDPLWTVGVRGGIRVSAQDLGVSSARSPPRRATRWPPTAAAAPSARTEGGRLLLWEPEGELPARHPHGPDPIGVLIPDA